MSQPLLFSEKSFATYSDVINSSIRATVAALTPADFITQEPEAIAAQLYEANVLEGLTILDEDTTQAYPKEIKIDVPDANTTSGQRLADGRRFKFNLPFFGLPATLALAPTGAEGAVPFGTIEGNVIHFQLEQVTDGNIEDLVGEYQTNVAQIIAFANALNTNMATFNTSLQQRITDWVTARKALLDKNLADAQNFGVPILP